MSRIKFALSALVLAAMSFTAPAAFAGCCKDGAACCKDHACCNKDKSCCKEGAKCCGADACPRKEGHKGQKH
ncbi:MAG: hypothetical protein IT168_00745 [Bryobacterales bacterium]|nr:hypothetical protein [Bryobacterales bacterium]